MFIGFVLSAISYIIVAEIAAASSNIKNEEEK